jgi:hypothetical protein
MFSKRMAIQALHKWHAAQVFVDLYFHSVLPENLHLILAVPESFFDAEDFGLENTKERLVPLLQVGGEDLVLFDDPDTGKLILISVNGPEVRSSFFSWQQFLADFILTLLEIGMEESNVISIGELIEAHGLEEIIAFWQHSRVLPPRDWQFVRQQFVRSLSC